MSELKYYDIMDIEAMDDERLEKSESGKIQATRVYIKDEVDKVIADLEESHKKEVGQLLIEIVELKAQKAQAEDDCAYWKSMAKKNAADNSVMAKQRTEALKRERYHKYKRCLEMAKLCHWKMGVFIYKEEKSNFYNRWHKRWLKIAELFKDKEA